MSVHIVSVEEVKARTTTLRTQYSKLLKPKSSGSGAKSMSGRQMWMSRSLEFLKKYIVQRATETSVSVYDNPIADKQTV